MMLLRSSFLPLLLAATLVAVSDASAAAPQARAFGSQPSQQAYGRADGLSHKPAHGHAAYDQPPHQRDGGDDFGSGFGGFGGGGGASSGSGDDGGSSSGGSSKGGSGSDGSGGGGSGGSGSRAGGFNQEILSYHNKARGDHSVGQLTWDDTLAKYATDYLNKVNCDFKHSGGKYGENIAMGYPTPTKAMEAWYNEGKDYNYNNPGFSEGTGHFTQMVWKGTNKIGCGQAKCSQGPYLVCEYDPAGNVEGGDNFKKNVLPPK